MEYEYKCIAAPEKARRRRGAKTRTDRVALVVEEILQAETKGGWEYLRADLFPVEEKSGIFGRTQEVHRAVLVFRRATGASSAGVHQQFAAPTLAQPVLAQPPAPAPAPAPTPAAEPVQPPAPAVSAEAGGGFRLAADREEAREPAPDPSGRRGPPKGLG